MSSHKGEKVNSYSTAFRSQHVSSWSSSSPKIGIRKYAELHELPTETFRRWTKAKLDPFLTPIIKKARFTIVKFGIIDNS